MKKRISHNKRHWYKLIPMWVPVGILLAILFLLSYIFTHIPKRPLLVPVQGPILMTIPQEVHALELSQHDQIENYIHEVFGKDANRALKLLSCENKKLDPEAVNDNTTWGGRGRDVGVFQINTYWQGVTNEFFLKDWRINILIAHNIFIRNHNSFSPWACNRLVKP